LAAERHEGVVWSHATSDIDRARLLAASSPHSGDCLAASPITSVGLRLSDEEIRIAVAHRLGCRACEPHTCAVDARGLHGLACRRSAPRQQRHSHLNQLVWCGKTESVPTAPVTVCHFTLSYPINIVIKAKLFIIRYNVRELYHNIIN